MIWQHRTLLGVIAASLFLTSCGNPDLKPGDEVDLSYWCRENQRTMTYEEIVRDISAAIYEAYQGSEKIVKLPKDATPLTLYDYCLDLSAKTKCELTHFNWADPAFFIFSVNYSIDPTHGTDEQRETLSTSGRTISFARYDYCGNITVTR